MAGTGNTMTALANVLYRAAGSVPREIVGMVGSVDSNFGDAQASQGDTIKVPKYGTCTENDYAPAMSTARAEDNTPTTVSLTLDYNKETSFTLTGDEEQQLNNGGERAMDYIQKKTEQGIRTLVNAMETRLCVAAKEGASRAVGTAGTTPFATTLDVLVDAQQILNDNGCPFEDRHVVLSSAAAAKIKKLVTINNQPVGSPAEQMLRAGTLINLHGFNIKESSRFAVHTIGANSGRCFSATEDIGDTSIAYDTGSGDFHAGDVVTFGSGGGTGTADANKYIVSAVNAATPLVLNAPGLLVAHADNDLITTGAAYTPNVAFNRSAIKLVVRPPFIPSNANIQTTLVGDPVSGFTFMFCRIVGDGMTMYRLNVVYGFKVIQSEYIALIMG